MSSSIQFVICLELLLLCMFAIAVLEKALIVVSGSAEENDVVQAFMFQNLFIFILSSDAFLLQIGHLLEKTAGSLSHYAIADIVP